MSSDSHLKCIASTADGRVVEGNLRARLPLYPQAISESSKLLPGWKYLVVRRDCVEWAWRQKRYHTTASTRASRQPTDGIWPWYIGWINSPELSLASTIPRCYEYLEPKYTAVASTRFIENSVRINFILRATSGESETGMYQFRWVRTIYTCIYCVYQTIPAVPAVHIRPNFLMYL
jgi:hypothetical protein